MFGCDSFISSRTARWGMRKWLFSLKKIKMAEMTEVLIDRGVKKSE